MDKDVPGRAALRWTLPPGRRCAAGRAAPSVTCPPDETGADYANYSIRLWIAAPRANGTQQSFPGRAAPVRGRGSSGET